MSARLTKNGTISEAELSGAQLEVKIYVAVY